MPCKKHVHVILPQLSWNRQHSDNFIWRQMLYISSKWSPSSSLKGFSVRFDDIISGRPFPGLSRDDGLVIHRVAPVLTFTPAQGPELCGSGHHSGHLCSAAVRGHLLEILPSAQMLCGASLRSAQLRVTIEFLVNLLPRRKSNKQKKNPYDNHN